MRKTIYIISSLAIVSFIGFGIINANGDANRTVVVDAQNNINYQIATSHAKMPYYEELNTLDNYSEVIVIGHVAGQQDTYQVKTDNGEVIDTLGKTPFQIDKVLKGNNITKETLVTVMEDGRVENGVYYNLEGYVKMNDSDQYMLFLRKTGDNTYAINGSYQGKFNIENADEISEFKSNAISEQQLENVEYIGENTDHFNKLKEEAIKKYKD
ncbi:hypothetical protein [Paenibacillus wynnii]|uniref:Uncharacterized protein n=1 Tax=Paenibacillus wynnii TaxID=268407 RepID=A0A098MB47_9BACL|nr:hypothetical protein [Paenibacillus wynnii]KGE19268.1 hypothetical protein PWYN_07820 [Paenibacillus wynnii]